MKAAVYRRYGPPEVVHLDEIEPPALGPEHVDRVLVRVQASSVNPFDVYYRSGFLPVRADNGWLKPKNPVLGIDVAGTVEAVGPGVTRFKVGDLVFGNCFGSHAEFVRVREKGLALLPRNLSVGEAAALPTVALTALQGLRDQGGVGPGQSVLVNGAAGGIGHCAVQIAAALGAEVTAVCSTGNVAWVEALGPARVIDYTREDFVRRPERYDVVFDAVGKRTYYASRSVLKPGGRVILENPLKVWPNLWQVGLAMLTGDRRVKMHLTEANVEDMDWLRAAVDAGKLKPVIERTYPLGDAAGAHRHVEGGHAKGKVVLDVCA